MKRHKHSRSIFKALVLLMFVVMLLMLTVQAIFLFKYRNAIVEKEITSLDTIARQARTSVNYELNSIKTSGISSFRNGRITDVLTGQSEDRSDCENALSEMIGLNRSIVAAYLLDMDMNCLCFSLRENADAALAEDLLELTVSGSRDRTHSLPSADGKAYFSSLQPVIFRDGTAMAPPDEAGGARQIGFIMFICSLNSLDSIKDSGDYKILVTSGAAVIASSGHELMADISSGDLDADLSEEYYSKDYDLDNGWTVRALASKAELKGEIAAVTVQTGALLFVVTVAAIGFAFAYLTKNLARPIKRMKNDLSIVADESPDHRLSAYPCNEIGQIAERVNSVLDHLEEARSGAMTAQQEKYESELLLSKAELDYIHAQVNPHFLYNSLETVCGMAAMGRTDLVIDTCTALSSLFRYSIHESDMVPLEEELKYARNYFYVMNHRYKGELELRINISDADRAIMVPKMILQPVLENSLKHGKMNTAEHGIVNVSAQRENEYFVICIHDNGAGIPMEKLQSIREQIGQSLRIDKEHGLGLRNLNARLRMSCGGESRVEIDSEENRYTLLKIIIKA